MYTAKDAEALVKRMKAEGKAKEEIVRQLAELCLGWPYVYAAAGEMCTPEWRKNRMRYSDAKYAAAIRDACPVLSGSSSSCASCKWDGRRCFDCRGFTRWLLEQAEITLFGGGATSQWETASNWAAKGAIESIPRGLVCCVFKRKEGKMSHTGMHLEGGNIIHCSTTVKTDTLPGRPAWTHWGIPAGLYTTEELRAAGLDVSDAQNTPTLRKGAEGELVKKLQARLNELTGAGLNVDGKFGAKTESAVIHFQELNNLHADGIVGPKTWTALGVKDINVPNNNVRNISPPVDNGSNEIQPEQPPTICIPYADWLEIKAAIAAVYHIVKKYEGVE